MSWERDTGNNTFTGLNTFALSLYLYKAIMYVTASIKPDRDGKDAGHITDIGVLNWLKGYRVISCS